MTSIVPRGLSRDPHMKSLKTFTLENIAKVELTSTEYFDEVLQYRHSPMASRLRESDRDKKRWTATEVQDTYSRS